MKKSQMLFSSLFHTATIVLLLACASLVVSTPVYAAAEADPDRGKLGGSWVYGGDLGRSIHRAVKNNDPSLGSTTHANLVYMGKSISLDVLGCEGAKDFCPPETRGTSYEKEVNEASAIGGIGKSIAALYQNKPADLALWVDDTSRSLGFRPRSAYAQGKGIGFTGLAPLLELWKASRNIAYAILAVFLIVIGFMVMFRKKIDPKTVVTVQNALPRVVITLLLITFSYAIVGLLIDLMYLLIALGIAVIGPSGYSIGSFSIPTASIQNWYLAGGLPALFVGVFGPLFNLPNKGDSVSSLGSALQAFQRGDYLSGIFSLPGLVGTDALGWIFTLILAIAFLIAFVRIFLMLLSAYVQLIFSVLVGPLQILTGALPGVEGFSSWIINVITNLVPFPITVFVLIIANWLGSAMTSGQLNMLWTPPLLPQIGGAGGFVSNFAYTVVWLGMIFSIPSIAGGIKEALKAKAAIPGGLGAITGVAGQSIGVLMQGYQFYTSREIMKAFKRQALGEKSEGGNRSE